MVSFIRKLWISSAGHAGIAIPIEAVGYIAKGKAAGFDCLLTCQDGKLIIEPVTEETECQ